MNKQHRFAQVPEFWIRELRGSSQMFAVALALALHDGDKGCFPSLEVLVNDTDLRKDVVKRTLDSLESRSIFTRYIESGRTFYALNRDPKLHESCDKLHDSCDIYHESCAHIRNGNRIITDQGTDAGPIAQTIHSDLGETDDPMSKLISQPRRVPPAAADTPKSRAGKKVDARYQDITNIIDKFARTFGMQHADNTLYTRKKWNELADKVGSVNEAWVIVQEAYACRTRLKLVNEQYPVFNVGTVLFYLNFKRDAELAKQAKSSPQSGSDSLSATISQYGKNENGEYEFDKLRALTRSMFSLSRADLSAAGVCDEFLNALYESPERTEVI